MKQNSNDAKPQRHTIHFETNEALTNRVDAAQAQTTIKARAEFCRILIDEALKARELASHAVDKL